MNKNKGRTIVNILCVIFAFFFLNIVVAVGITANEMPEWDILHGEMELLSVEATPLGTTYYGHQADEGYEYYKVTSTLKNMGDIKEYISSIFLEYKAGEQYDEYYDEFVTEYCEHIRMSGTETPFGWDNMLIIPAQKTGKKVDIVQVPTFATQLAVTYRSLDDKDNDSTAKFIYFD